MMGRLTTAKLDSTCPKTAVKFINTFIALIVWYNDQQPELNALLNQAMACVLVQTAALPVAVLKDGKNRDHERIVQGLPCCLTNVIFTCLQIPHRCMISDVWLCRVNTITSTVWCTMRTHHPRPMTLLSLLTSILIAPD